MSYPRVYTVAEYGGWGFYRLDSRDAVSLCLGWQAGKKAEAHAEVLRLRAELAASRPVVCATCRRETLPGLLAGDDCITCDAARYVPKGE